MTTAMLSARKNATIFFILCAPLFLFYAGYPGTSYGFTRSVIVFLIPVVYQSVFRLRKRLRSVVQKNAKSFNLWFFPLHFSILWQHRAIRQVLSARDFVPRQGLGNAGILYVFQVFQTEGLGQKIRRKPPTQLCGVAFITGFVPTHV
jgi:hypothetical protein